ncbi:MAG: LemA family protein [Armatimonadota bacterium]|nr:LemA family protein [Armatimonadota bacterium]MDW8107718.1 LemA family protein [Armatimonadota bacterium]
MELITGLICIGAGALGLAILYALLYNSLVGKKNQVEYAYSGIDVQLKKRHDLIPNLVATVKQYMQHERELLERITELRSRAINPNLSDAERMQVENALTAALRNLMIAVENYPQLRANENFMHLQASLNEVEEQIAAARRTYNAAVTDYNNAIEMFPTNLVAATMGLQRRAVFEAEESERATPNVAKLFQQ